MATIDKSRVIAVISDASSKINREYVLSTSAEGREWLKEGKKANTILLIDDGVRAVTCVTDLTSRTIESRLDTEYYLNI